MKTYFSKAASKNVVALAIFLLFSCTFKDSKKNQNINLISAKVTIESKTQIKGNNVFFGPQLYRSSVNNNNLYINDHKFCFTAIIDKEYKVSSIIKKDEIGQVNECHHSIYQKKDTTYIYYHESSRVLKLVKGKLHSVTKLTLPDSVIGINRYLPFTVLENNNILIPIGENIMKTPDFYRQNFGMKKLKEYNLGQSLFAIYDSNGKLISEFGEFPSIFGIENLMYASPQSYYYSISNNSIFICYPISNEIIEYNFNGVKINSYNINLPKFNYPKEKHEGWVDTIYGFASYEDNKKGVGFYFFTFQKEDGEIKQWLHQYNINENLLKSGIIKDQLYAGMILQNATYEGVKYLTMPWNEEPVEVIDLSVN